MGESAVRRGVDEGAEHRRKGWREWEVIREEGYEKEELVKGIRK